jgi:hypothetical protein
MCYLEIAQLTPWVVALKILTVAGGLIDCSIRCLTILFQLKQIVPLNEVIKVFANVKKVRIRKEAFVMFQGTIRMLILRNVRKPRKCRL